MRDPEPYEPDGPDGPDEPALSADEAPDAADDDIGALRITSLRPAPHPFSMRRLLNWESLIVAAITLLALIGVWLPGIISQRVGSSSDQNGSSLGSRVSSERGDGWQPIGPSWAQDVAFAADGRTGYICGPTGLGDTPVLVARFDVRTALVNTWSETTNPATGIRCQIAVSPLDPNEVALAVDDCRMPTVANCPESISVSRMFRSHDGGATWARIPLPASLAVYGVAWGFSALFVQVWGQLNGDGAATPTAPAKASAHLLVSRDDGPFTEVGAEQLVGRATQFDYIALFSSGQTLFVALNSAPCSGYCLTIAHTSDDGDHWQNYTTTYASRPITPAFAQPNSLTLIGWVFRQSDQKLALLRSRDAGAHWTLLPDLPRNPSTGGVTVFATPNGTLYVASYGVVHAVYELPAGQDSWRSIAPMPTGMPLAVQYDAAGQAVALWGQASEWSFGSAPPGLEFYPLTRANG
jgi:hypothetical protein